MFDEKQYQDAIEKANREGLYFEEEGSTDDIGEIVESFEGSRVLAKIAARNQEEYERLIQE